MNRHVNTQGSSAFQSGEYEDAEQLVERGKKYSLFSKRISDLQVEWLTEIHLNNEADNDNVSSSYQDGPELIMNYGGSEARAIYNRGWLVLQAGSTIKKQTCDSLSGVYRELRHSSLQDGKLEEAQNHELLRLIEDIRFNSPSGAAQFVAGCSVSGNREWKLLNNNESLGVWLRKNLKLRITTN